MKLEKWAHVAEIISSLAVIVTLVILILGIRQNTSTLIATSAAASRDSLAALNDQALTLADENFALLTRSLDPTAEWEDFTAAVRFWLQLFQRAFLQRGEAQYFRFRNGLLEEDVWQTVRYRMWTNINLSPTSQEIWRNDRTNVYTPGFVEAIESYEPPEAAGG